MNATACGFATDLPGSARTICQQELPLDVAAHLEASATSLHEANVARLHCT